VRQIANILRTGSMSVAALCLGVLALAAPAAQASQRPAPRPPAAATYPYNFSRVAWTGSEEVIAATDKHGDLYYFWQASGSTAWHKQLVAGATSLLAYSKPSITVAGATVYIAAVDASGDLYYFTKTGTAKWRQVLLSTPGSSRKFQAPSIAVGGDGSVLISVGNTVGQLVNFTLAPGSSSWAEQTVAFGQFGPSSVTTVFDSYDSQYLGLITASSGGTLYFFWEYLSAPAGIRKPSRALAQRAASPAARSPRAPPTS
jgi:PQQ-like domain